MGIVNYCKNHQNKKLYVVGVNEKGKTIRRVLADNNIKITGFIVSDEYTEQCNAEEPIVAIRDINNANDITAIIAIKYRDYSKVISELAEVGVTEYYFCNGIDDYRLLQKYNDFYSQDDNQKYPEQQFYYDGAKRILEYLIEKLDCKSVVDFGCGCGTWLKAVKDICSDVRVLGIDNSTYDRTNFLEPNEFLKHDLSEPIQFDQKFDLAISIEVAEHLDESVANAFVKTICETSDVVLFSAAVKYQGGDHHVNEQYQSYWIEKFKKNGYRHIDCIRPRFWMEKNIDVVYRENCFLYVKESEYGRIKELFKNDGEEMVDIVHPYLFSLKMRAYIDGDF